MKPAFHRRVTTLERVFTLLHDMAPPFATQLVLEGSGELDLSRWETAVAAACEANPGSRLVYKGCWRWATWVDSGAPAPVRLIDGNGWSGHGPEGAPFLRNPLPFKTTNSCEVLLVAGNPPRVVFRCLHAVMDGRGTLYWVEDIFRALRGEPLIGAHSMINDEEFSDDLKIPNRQDRKTRRYGAPTGAADGVEQGNVWRRARLDGRFTKLLPLVALAMAKAARKRGEEDVCFNVPADLRFLKPHIRSTANLSCRFILDIPPEATVDSLQKQIFVKMRNMSRESRFMNLLSQLPLGVLKYIFVRVRKRNLGNGLYYSSGTITYPGKLPMAAFQGGGFGARTGFFIPPDMEGKPLFAVLAHCGDGVEIVASAPKPLATNGRLEDYLHDVVSCLKTL